MQNLITIEDEKVITINGATKVVSSTPTQSVILTEKNQLTITGSELEVKKLNIENNEVVLSGNIFNVKFCNKQEKQPFLKRLFK